MEEMHEDPTARPRAGSWASIENRVERLEERVGELEKAVAGVSLSVTTLNSDIKLIVQSQDHAKQLMELRFRGLDNTLKEISHKLDSLSHDGSPAAQMATLGVQDIQGDLQDLKATVVMHQQKFDQITGLTIAYRYVIGAGVMALAMSAAALLHSLGVL